LVVNVIAKRFVNFKDFRIVTLWIAEPFVESLRMKMLEHLYVGRISSVVGDYVLKLVSACPKVTLFRDNISVDSSFVVECLEWWSDGFEK
jgi:hypothetical protein